MSKIEVWENEVYVSDRLQHVGFNIDAYSSRLSIYGFFHTSILLSKSELEDFINHLTKLKNKMQ